MKIVPFLQFWLAKFQISLAKFNISPFLGPLLCSCPKPVLNLLLGSCALVCQADFSHSTPPSSPSSSTLDLTLTLTSAPSGLCDKLVFGCHLETHEAWAECQQFSKAQPNHFSSKDRKILLTPPWPCRNQYGFYFCSSITENLVKPGDWLSRTQFKISFWIVNFRELMIWRS